MICRRCLSSGAASSALGRVTTVSARSSPSIPALAASRPSPTAATTRRAFSVTFRNQTTSDPPPQPPSPGPEGSSKGPVLTTPLADAPKPATPVSSCPEGTVLSGLNFFKNKQDPVALADDAYPAWLWKVLDKPKAEAGEEADDSADQFAKSKKLRRLHAKRQRAREARLLAEGNLEALAPKIPMSQQTVNLPGNEEGTTEGALAASDARKALTNAMRKERRAKIKEDNYLSSM